MFDVNLKDLLVSDLCEKSLRKSMNFNKTVLEQTSTENLAAAYIVAKRMLKSVESKANPSERVISCWKSNLTVVEAVVKMRKDEIIALENPCVNKKERDTLAELKGRFKTAA